MWEGNMNLFFWFFNRGRTTAKLDEYCEMSFGYHFERAQDLLVNANEYFHLKDLQQSYTYMSIHSFIKGHQLEEDDFEAW